MSNPSLSLERLHAAHARIAPSIHRTPLIHSSTLSERAGAPVWLKCENLQKTGAFKVRGALHRLLTLTPEQRARGVATISAGNHAQAVAWAASAAGVKSLVVMPERASPTKVRASREYGAEVVLHGDATAAFARVREICEERDMTFVHPFDDVEVVAGHASCGLEILEDLPNVGTIVVPVGGGGLSSAVTAAVVATDSDADVWGVEPEGAAGMHRSLAAGRAMHLDSFTTVADGLAAPMAGVLNHAILAEHARGVVLVSDEAILSSLELLLERTKLLVEPSGAAGLAALLSGQFEVRRDRPVVIVLSGGNADLAQLGSFLSRNR
ncbi:MAG: threonine/serine dehydratase [Gemmatimonadetes bacterium]|nr:threonine/serine dehydratase [Gemmatimonadota bacterium]MDA1104303.1 threonine/serine dehydratase [Gemmatimonadota bacterium]